MHVLSSAAKLGASSVKNGTETILCIHSRVFYSKCVHLRRGHHRHTRSFVCHACLGFTEGILQLDGEANCRWDGDVVCCNVAFITFHVLAI